MDLATINTPNIEDLTVTHIGIFFKGIMEYLFQETHGHKKASWALFTSLVLWAVEGLIHKQR
jgi:hypothetical protein